jgi:hypothetical protein
MKGYRLCAGKTGGDVMVSYKEVIGCTEGYAWYAQRFSTAWIHRMASLFQETPPHDYEHFKTLVKNAGGDKGEKTLRVACSMMLRHCSNGSRTPAPLTAALGFRSPESWETQVEFLVTLNQRYQNPGKPMLEIKWRTLQHGAESFLI